MSTFGAYRRNSRGAVAACLVTTMTASSASLTPTRASRTWPSACAWKVKVSLRAEGGRIPEMKRVVVAHQNRVVMEETLDAGLARLFGGAVEPAAAAAAPTGAVRPGDGRAADLARRAAESYQRAVEAQRSGDWARYGEELSRLGEVLRQLQTVLGGRQP